MDPQIIDRIYESAFVAECWPGVLDDLAKIASARAGFLFVSNGDVHQFTSSTVVGFQAIKPLVENGWIARCERFRRLLAVPHSGFLSDSAIYSEVEMRTDPFYRDILYPRGLGWAAGTAVPLPTGDCFTVSLERDYASGPVDGAAIDELDKLRPHLARSALMAARLRLERARTASDTLALIGLAALVLDQSGKVLAANSLIESLGTHVQWRAFNRVSLNDKNADQLLHDAIAGIARSGGADVRSFPVRDHNMEATMIAHVVPVCLSSRDVFVRSAAVLIVTPVVTPLAPPVELVQSLFDLTPAEARIARCLADGEKVRDIANNSGLSVNTIRTHVYHVLQKTGCNRQSEVVKLLTSISRVGPDKPEPESPSQARKRE